MNSFAALINFGSFWYSFMVLINKFKRSDLSYFNLIFIIIVIIYSYLKLSKKEVDFVKKNDNCKIFASIDNNQYNAFVKLLAMIPHKDHITTVKESDLKKDSIEYKLSLIIDTLLNIKRLSK